MKELYFFCLSENQSDLSVSEGGCVFYSHHHLWDTKRPVYPFRDLYSVLLVYQPATPVLQA